MQGNLDMLDTEFVGNFESRSLAEHAFACWDVVFILKLSRYGWVPLILLLVIFCLSQGIDNWGCHYPFFQVIKCWLSQYFSRLCKVQNVIVYLKSDAEMCTKIEGSPLLFVREVHDESDCTAANRNHWGCFEVGLGNVGVEVLVIKELIVRDWLEVSLRLNQLSEDKVIQDSREQLRYVSVLVELVCEHATGSWNHEVRSGDGIKLPVNLESCHFVSSLLCMINYIVLK